MFRPVLNDLGIAGRDSNAIVRPTKYKDVPEWNAIYC